MSSATKAPFVTRLRTRGDAIRLGTPGAGSVTVRVEVAERWDVVVVEAASGTTVAEVKTAVMRRFDEDGDPNDWVMKLRGLEVLDEGETLAEAGALDGSIFLLQSRRRRPVR